MSNDVKPCPFCGCTRISICQGSTFRWFFAECDDCGARSGEVRRQTLGEGTNKEWDKQVGKDAMEAWNERTDDA